MLKKDQCWRCDTICSGQTAKIDTPPFQQNLSITQKFSETNSFFLEIINKTF